MRACIVRAAAAAALGLAASLPLAADHVPVLPGAAVEGQGRTFVTAELGRLDPVLELRGNLLDPVGGYRAVTLGAYYRVHRNVKLGAFYRLQWGALHDDDWLGEFIATDWHWWWDDTSDRPEQLLILDLSPRFLMPFLPGGNWVLQVKSRYELNTFNLQQSLLVRPEFTYFLLIDRRPVLNVAMAYGLYFPLNFGDSLLYEHTPYLALLYHLSPVVQLELSGAYRTRIWSTSRDVAAGGEPSYVASLGSLEVGLGLILRAGN